MENLLEKYRIEIIKSESTPKVEFIDDVKSFLKENEELLSAIGIFLLNLNKEKTSIVALAANQLSINGERLNKNFFIINLKLISKPFELIINPVIHSKLGSKRIMYEGCATWPGLLVKVERQPAITASYHDYLGNLHDDLLISGFEAQIWQHETDHLLGIKENLVITAPKHQYFDNIGRNDDCPCGSGKKYKKCCWEYDQTLY